MSATYEVLEPGGHARLVGNVLDRIARASSNPASSAGSAAALLDAPTEGAWLARESVGEGSALVESVKGNTLRWNQLVGSSDTSVIVPSGHKYVSRIDGTAALATSDGTAISVTGGTDNIFDLTQMFGAGNEPATVDEFEQLYPASYYPYDAGSLLDVEMAGIETVGFNQWDEQWVNGNINEDGTPSTYDGGPVRSKNYIPVFPSTAYYCRQFAASNQTVYSVYCYDANKDYIGVVSYSADGTFTPLAGTHYIMFRMYIAYGTTYKHDICVNLSDPARNGEYEPHWSSSLSLPATDLRSAGTVRDEQRAGERVTRVGAVDLGTLTWTESTNVAGSFTSSEISDIKLTPNSSVADIKCARYQTYSGNAVDSSTAGISGGLNNSKTVRVHDPRYAGDAATFKTAMDGVTLNYELATPTTTTIDPPLCMSYRTEKGGTERVTVTSGSMSAPPVISARQGADADALRDRALSAIAPVEGATASANYAVGSYLVHGGKLYKVTSAIASGESITPGTNVMATTVMAEVIALTS